MYINGITSYSTKTVTNVDEGADVYLPQYKKMCIRADDNGYLTGINVGTGISRI